MPKIELTKIQDASADLSPRCFTLEGAVRIAIEACWNSVENLEEHGGIILHHPSKDIYEFVFLHNMNTGTPKADGLWSANPKEYGEKIIPRFKDGWKQYASFHTHPQFQAWPSWIDLTQLFQSFNINLIYSPVQNITKLFKWNTEPQKEGFDYILDGKIKVETLNNE